MAQTSDELQQNEDGLQSLPDRVPQTPEREEGICHSEACDQSAPPGVSATNRTLQQRLRHIVTGVTHMMPLPPDWLLCILIGSVALGFNLYRLGSPSLWFDEVLSVERARQSLSLLWHIVFKTQQNMALYYVLLHFWLTFTAFLRLSAIESVVRFPSAVFAALGSMMVFLLGRRFMGILGSLVAAGLYMLNSLQLVYAQEARSYSLQLLLLCVAWYALFTVFARAHQKRWWACYSAAMTLAIYAHLFSTLILLAQGVTMAGLLILPGPWRDKTRRQFLPFIMSLISICILSNPMLLAARHGSKTGWLPIPHLKDIPYLFFAMSGSSGVYVLLIALCCTLGLSLAILVHSRPGIYLLNRLSPAESVDGQRMFQLQQLLAVAFALVNWILVPIAVSYVVSKQSLHLYSIRYLVTIVPPFFLLAGLGVAVLRWHIRGVRWIAPLLPLSLFVLASYSVTQYYKTAQVEDWRSPALWLEQHYQPGDGIVCYNNAQGCQVSIEYYLRAYPSHAHFPADSPGSFSWVNYDLTNHLGNFAAAVDTTVLATYGAKHHRLFFLAGRFANDSEAELAKAAQQWLGTHYHLIAQTTKGAVRIHLYATTAVLVSSSFTK